jgi:hypothetical protein
MAPTALAATTTAAGSAAASQLHGMLALHTNLKAKQQLINEYGSY